ncbi:MAG: SGNH/GDSL hydrolase family protein [Polyangiales bacterium]
MVQIASNRSKLTLTVLSALLFGGCADSETSLDGDTSVDPLAQEATADETAPADTAAPDASAPRWADREDLGVGNGSDVIMMGDSWMSGALCFSAGCQAGINEAITSVGKKKYRNYAISATQLSTGAIPRQFTQAVRANKDIKTVIMTGGGNDVLIGGASGESAGKLIMNELNKLWTTMSEAGVKDIVYIQYSSSAGGAASRGTRVDDNAPPPAIPICQTGPVICHSVPTSDIISRSDLADGIHPGRAGNRRIAERVLKILEERKIRR